MKIYRFDVYNDEEHEGWIIFKADDLDDAIRKAVANELHAQEDDKNIYYDMASGEFLNVVDHPIIFVMKDIRKK